MAIDLRSDTVTTPTPEMRRAMAEAVVGDDIYGEDPTVARLEQTAAAMLGKEAGLYVPSGTMGNLVAVMTHAPRGGEVLLEAEAHIYYYEAGGMAVAAQVLPRLIAGDHGVFTAQALKASLRPTNVHFPPPALVCLENTHNRAGGAVWPMAELAAVAETAHEAGLPVHLDGARIFNAALAAGIDAAEIARPVDSVMFCLSKGLSAPVGSVVVGTAEWVERARRNRKILGGAMRQSGVIAAAGLVALQRMVDRLVTDHANARRLAEGLGGLPGLRVDLERVQTNIVMCDVSSLGVAAPEFARRLAERGVLANAVDARRLRLVTHKDVSLGEVESALSEIAGVCRSLAA